MGQEDVTPDVVSPAGATGAWIAVKGSGFAPVGAQSVRLSGAIF